MADVVAASSSAGAAETRTCVLRFDGTTLRARFRDGAEVGLDDARENLARSLTLTGRPVPTLIDMRPVRSKSAEAREAFAGPEGTAIASALALLVSSPLSRVVGSFFMLFNRPASPTRLFTSEAEAEAWLAGFASAAPKD